MILLRRMTEKEFTAYLEAANHRYAEENIAVGYWTPEEALARSRSDHAKLLPDGIATPDNYFYTIVDEEAGQAIGTLWLGANPRTSAGSGFIYDLFIDEAHRGRGAGKAAMTALESEGRRLGMHTLYLHVFAGNSTARALYSRLGYETTSLNMVKRI